MLFFDGMGLRLDRIESWNGDDSVNLFKFACFLQSVSFYMKPNTFKLELSYMFLEVCLGTIYWSTSTRPGPVTSGTTDDGIL